MPRGAMLINTSRGALLNSRALIDALRRGLVATAGLLVYEEEEDVFSATSPSRSCRATCWPVFSRVPM